jgi:hypothetical protein
MILMKRNGLQQWKKKYAIEMSAHKTDKMITGYSRVV